MTSAADVAFRPASAGQEQLWITQQQNPASTAYNMCALFELTGPLDVDRLRAGLRELVRRHEVLRTALAMVDGDVQQVVRPDITLDMPVHDIRNLPEHEKTAVLDEVAATELTRPFDIERGPLFRARLLRHDKQRHYLYVSVHHAISDGWSMRLFFDELIDTYAHPPQKDDLQATARRTQYADYVSWQRAMLASPRHRELSTYWQRVLDDAPPLLGHPTDRHRSVEHTEVGASLTVELDTTLMARVRTKCGQLRLTPFSVVFAAYSLVLSRLAGRHDIVVGVPMDGRGQHEEFHDVFGLFVNVVPIRLRYADTTEAADYLIAARDALLDGYAHHELPFQDIVAAVAPERSPIHTPVYQVMCGTAILGEAERERDGLRWRTIRLPENTAKLDLNLTLWQGGGRSTIHLNFNASLFAHDRVTIIADQVVAVIAQLCADPTTPLGDVDLRTPSSRAILPDLTAPLPPSRSAPDLMKRIARGVPREPDRIVARDRNEALTCAEFWRRTQEIMTQLRGDGVTEHDRVAVLAERSVWLPCVLCAILDLGATFVLLDSTLPVRRIDTQIEAARPAVVIAFETDVPSVRPTSNTRSRPGAPHPTGAGHVLFTSGSSATPVPVTSGIAPLANFLAWQADTFGLTADDRVGVLSGLGHDPLLRDLFAPLWSNSSAHFPEPRWHTDPRRTNKWLASEGITVVHITPSQLELLSTCTADDTVPSLRLLFLGGEQLTGAHVAMARRWAPNATVVNAYGATETPQIAAYHVVDADAPDAPIPVGRGAAGAQLAVLTATSRPAGVGELGEIVVRSRHLAEGYLPGSALPRPDAFQANPCRDDPHDRVYRTGDLGRHLPSGEVVFEGRHDRRLNLNGHRVEPGEAEAALLDHDAVAKAAVVLRPGDELLTAFCVSMPGTRPTPAELRRHLADLLPGYLVPGAIVLIDHLPITPGGKTDYSALAGWSVAPPPTEAEFAPRDAVEAAVARCWADVVGNPPTDREQSFFTVAHSLTAMRLVVRIRRELSVDFPFRKVFEYPSVAGIANHIVEQRRIE